MQKPRPTDEEFADLARKRDEAVEALVKTFCEKEGWDPTKVSFHASHMDGCYCACPDGPCQHVWDGPDVPLGLEEGEDESQAHGWSSTCSKCGMDSFSHSMRVSP